MSELIKVENGKAYLSIHIPGEDYTNALNAAYRRIAGKFKVEGFRPGKAPRRVIEQHYGDSAFWDKEFDALIQNAYFEALTEHKLVPELDPEFEINDYSEENGVDFKANVVLRPEVKLGQYKGIAVPKAEYNITDEDVEAEILKRRENISSTEDVERPLENGDTAVIDFAGFLGDEQFEGGTAEGYSLEVGSHTFIPGFEEQMIGMNIGETRDINVTFPAEYHAENLAGKDVVFKVTLHSLQTKHVPDFDEDFVKDTSDFDTVEEYRANIRKELEEAAEHRANENRKNAILEKAIENATVEIHDDIIKEEVDMQIKRLDDQMHQFGADLNGYLQYANRTLEQLRGEYADSAKRNLKAQYVLLSIIEAEDIKPTDDDYRSVIHNAGHEQGQHWDDEKIDAELEKNRSKYASQALFEAVIRFVTENAVEA
ncbi:MAG: trigger factor [Clostridia bacterium]|nr:trigger factor [Clostridia bacterium]